MLCPSQFERRLLKLMILTILKAVAISALLLGLPLLGAWWAGKPVTLYLYFPPQPVPTEAEPFSWPLFWLGLLMEIPLYGGVGWMLVKCKRPGFKRYSFPAWGFIALVWLAVVWYLAWVRPKWLGTLADFTFTPLWLGYIAVINALCQWRRGTCPLTERPGFMLGLFPASALFWWYFEYLNRFVGNWHYLGAENLTGWQYFWRATLPFSTVLPALVSTTALLATFFAPVKGLPSLQLRYPHRWALRGLILASFGLLGIGLWPQWCFPWLWLAPLLLVAGLQVLWGQESYFSPLHRGRWEVVVLPMLAGLICGFFWEMWNYLSFPKWVYTVPYVSEFKLFEMPILGWAGYLPFGLECALVTDCLEKWGQKRKPTARPV
jgi:hypothetical protein